ncbi:MAG: hydroxyethylthiazole kinase [Methanosarcinales archaeon]|jgi:hydroxyethylthiazole kinase|nr:hydroxyethylthiazole kinase [Methanosarcinales archaeon]
MTLKLSENANEKVAEALTNTKQTVPLVHCITNRVTITDCANGILACGAAPIMAEDLREVEEITSISRALVLNIGTLMPLQIEAMLKAGKKAKQLGVPVVFDPVGAGATKLRDEVSKQIIDEVKPDIIRGNMSEIRALYGFAGHTKGVEAAASDAVTLNNAEEAAVIIKEMAEKFDCVVAATGEIDILSDGKTVYLVANGHPMLCKITGSGCVLSALTGAYAGAAGKSKEGFLEAAVGAFVLSGLAGESAYAEVEKAGAGTGMFHTKYMDALNLLNADDFRKKAKIYVEED